MSRPDVIGALTQSLARPVSCGLLAEAHAYAAIVAAVARATTADDDLEAVVAIWWHILVEHIRVITQQRDLVTHRIRRSLRPMIGTRQPWNVLMATAHDLNGAGNFPMSENEVASIVKTEVWFALPHPPGRYPNGR
jgi:hypothetical protein